MIISHYQFVLVSQNSESSILYTVKCDLHFHFWFVEKNQRTEREFATCSQDVNIIIG